MRDAYDVILGPLVTEKLGRIAGRAAAVAESQANKAARKKGKADSAKASAEPALVRNVLAFKVRRDANKLEIRHAVEEIWKDKKIKVESVRTMNYDGKLKRLGRFEGHRSDWKKAIVTLAPGQSIPELS